MVSTRVPSQSKITAEKPCWGMLIEPTVAMAAKGHNREISENKPYMKKI
jgi:hypothetical protein